MNQSKENFLNQLIDDGYSFHFGDYISKGFDLFKQNIGGFAGFTFLFMVIAMFSNFIPILGSFVFSLVLSPALTVGFFIVANKIDKGEQSSFGDFFKGFDHIGPLMLIALTSMVISLLCLAPIFGGTFFLMMSSGDIAEIADLDFAMWTFAFIIPMIYLVVAWGWSALFVVFYDIPFWEAMEMSRKIITKNWFIIFLFGIVIGVIAGLGVVMLGFGIFFTFPIYFCAMYAAFADVTKLLDEHDYGIESHLVD